MIAWVYVGHALTSCANGQRIYYSHLRTPSVTDGAPSPCALVTAIVHAPATPYFITFRESSFHAALPLGH